MTSSYEIYTATKAAGLPGRVLKKLGGEVVDAIIAEMEPLFKKGVFDKKTSFRFSVDGETINVIVDAETCTVDKGTSTGNVDCSCKTSAEMFRKIWHDGYRPGMMDFFGGAIKADTPFLLPQFLKAFGKL